MKDWYIWAYCVFGIILPLTAAVSDMPIMLVVFPLGFAATLFVLWVIPKLFSRK